MNQIYTEKINELKAQYADDPAKFKYIDALGAAIGREENEDFQKEIYEELLSGLQNWQLNPLNPEELEIKGYAGLLNEIRTYESDTFSADLSGINGQETVLVAEKLVDWLIENRLDGVIINDILNQIRDEK